MTTNNTQHAKFTTPAELRILRTLPGPIERIWDYLVDPEKRARWFAGGPMEPRTGGKMELHFLHKNLAPDETPPDAHQETHTQGSKMTGNILRWEPPHVLSYTFSDDSDVTFELTPQGKNVLLVLTHRSRGEDLPYITGFASGWHTHLAHLIALLEGAPRPPFWPMFAGLKAEYETLKPALPSA